tara:strand:- start:3470 stop:4765 length:1296 start_codon:yes stop_codon:yes gene_type:complete
MNKKKISSLFRKYTNLIFLVSIISTGIIFNSFYSAYKKKENDAFQKLISNIYLKKTAIATLNSFNPRQENIKYVVKPGDNFEKILKNLDLPTNEIELIIKSFKLNKKKLRVYENQVIEFSIDRKRPVTTKKISIELTKSKNLVIARNLSENNFSFKEIERNLKKKLFYKESIITKSLYASGIETEIPIEIIIEFARLYGFQFDFQRDIWKNDSFQIVYEQYHDSKNTFIKNGEIIFAKLNLQGKEYPLYKFKSKDMTDYFDERGQSVKKTLMKTPINGARLSSSFGMRKHPILGFNKMHKGTDFAAPMGTPIMASGDGKVIKSSWCGGGGNCIKIKHNSTYTTVYAHLSKFGRGIKKGVRVKQGQIIGYVGSTGMSTGPHLHYEVIENGKKINSQTLKLPSGKTLLGEERKKFEVEKMKIEILKSDLIYNS